MPREVSTPTVDASRLDAMASWSTSIDICLQTNLSNRISNQSSFVPGIAIFADHY